LLFDVMSVRMTVLPFSGRTCGICDTGISIPQYIRFTTFGG
jgi:hypothetical protein